jgi:cell division protein FtsQ
MPVIAAAVLGAGAFLLITDGGREVRAGKALWPRIERAMAAAGLGVDQVAVTGHTFTPDAEIYDAIDLDNVRTFTALDTAAVRSRIERLPWVATAELTRTYPGRLDVRIRERKPFAVWLRRGDELLIDRTGRVLARISAGSVAELPRVAGEGANEVFAAFGGLLERFPAIGTRVVRAEWVVGRRWTLVLAGGVSVHLPADREATALAEIAARADMEELLSRPGRVIDLRGPGRITVREATGPGGPAGKA